MKPVAPVAFAERAGRGWRFVAENLPPGEHGFQLRPCERAKPQSSLAALPDVLLPSGYTYLQETWRIIRSPLLERTWKHLRTAVEAGRTAKVEYRKDFTRMEFLKEMMTD